MDKIDKADQRGKLDQHGYFGQRIAAIPAPTWLRTTAILWFVATIAVLLVGFRQALFIAPPDAELGNVQRIFYYHLPFAILGLVFPYVNLIASLAYLYLRHRNPLKALTADALAVASAQVTVLYVTLGLASGMLYGRPVWGIWWTWDARLTTYFILWLLYVSYLLTRKLAPSEQIAPLSSVLAIFAAVDIPIVFMSIRWWRTQHPSPIFAGGQNSGLDHSMYAAVLWNMAGWAMWGIFVLCFRFAIERRSQLAEQEYALQAIEASLHEYQG
jgi:heme exporter protein C